MVPVTSGVPQGSLLGPLMFFIFINDLPDAIKGEVNTALYADNSKIFGAVLSLLAIAKLYSPPY